MSNKKEEIQFSDIYEKLYYSYLTYYDKIWDTKTYEVERSKLKTIVRAMRKSGFSGIAFYNALKEEGYAPYTIKSLVQRAASLYQHGQDSDFLSKFNNPMKDLLIRHPQLFRNAYKTERLTIDFDEAKAKILTIQNVEVRDFCLALLMSGLRIHEAYIVNQQTSSVVGKGDKERYVMFDYPHQTFPPASTVRRTLAKLGLKPHTLRKLLATKLSRSDMTYTDICAVLGWSSLQTAAKYLQPLKEEQLKQKMKEILK